MLSPRYRLKNKFDFQKAYKYGQSRANSYLVIYVFSRGKDRSSLAGPRIGFSVSKRLGCAVIRNKIKRRMRAAIKPYLQLIPSHVDIIFIARKKIKGIPFSDVEKSMDMLLKKTGVIKEKKLLK